MPNDFISREEAIELCSNAQGKAGSKAELAGISKIWHGLKRLPVADVAPVVRCGKDRLTKLGANGIYGLLKVKDNEQEVDSPYKNTLAAIVECFQRLAEYENTEFGMDGGEPHAE